MARARISLSKMYTIVSLGVSIRFMTIDVHVCNGLPNMSGLLQSYKFFTTCFAQARQVRPTRVKEQ